VIVAELKSIDEALPLRASSHAATTVPPLPTVTVYVPADRLIPAPNRSSPAPPPPPAFEPPEPPPPTSMICAVTGVEMVRLPEAVKPLTQLL
jgi:hypothetical protein